MSTTSALDGFEFPVADREKWLSLVEGAKGGVKSADELVSLTDDGIGNFELGGSSNFKIRADLASAGGSTSLDCWMTVRHA